MHSIKTMVMATLIALGATGPAMSAVVINGANTNFSFNVDYMGHVGGSYTNDVSALSTFTFTGLSNSNRTYNFNYSLTNDSNVGSRLRSFGFNEISAATLTGLSSTGTFSYAEQNANYPEGVGNIEICFASTDNGTCTGGPSGLTSNPDQTGTGTFALTLSQAVSSISLDDFVVRFQSIAPTINGSSSGVGIGTVTDFSGPVSAAPEPMTWAMMILGFGLIGATLRRRSGERAMLTRA